MGKKGNAFAALIAELEKRFVNGEAEYLTFPQARVFVAPDALVFDPGEIEVKPDAPAGAAQGEALERQEDFARLVNQIPPAHARFDFDGRVLWSVYGRVMNTADLALGGDEEIALDIAQEFQTYKFDFDLAERASITGVGSTYYPTDRMPKNDLKDNSVWTPIVLGESDFDELGVQASDGVRSWLSDVGLLDDPLGSNISLESVSIEVFPLTILRPWLHPKVFESRAWRWEDEPLSDRGNPPKGMLPAYITGLILARNLVMDLKVKLPQIGSMPPTKPGLTLVAQQFAPQISIASGAKSAHRHPKAAAGISIKQFVQSGIATKPEGDTATGTPGIIAMTLGGAVARFPVPADFDCDRHLGTVSSALNATKAEQQRLERVVDELQRQIDDLQKKITKTRNRLTRFIKAGLTDKSTITIRNHSTGKDEVIKLRDLKVRLNQMERDMKRKVADRDKAKNDLPAQSKAVKQLAKTQGQLELLCQIESGGDDVFILGFVCEKLPKSPDPDPELFAV